MPKQKVAEVVPPKIKYAEWEEGDEWPADVPRRVRNKMSGEIIFYNQQRRRPGAVFLIDNPRHYSLLSMEPAELQDERAEEARVAEEHGQGRRHKLHVKGAQSTHAPKSSADVASSFKRQDADDDAPTNAPTKGGSPL